MANKVKSKIKSARIITASKGMRDILPADQPFWQKIRDEAHEIAGIYNFKRIDTPILESADLFERPLGEASEVVQKQMFVLSTKGGDRLALRPEGTAGIARAYIQHGLSHLGQPLKLFYIGPMFRYERPQAGRARQFHQAGFEIFTSEDDPIYDAQIVLACLRTLEAMKIKNLHIHVNSIGCRTCRPVYRKKLVDYYKGKKVCADCVSRLKINPLRVLDCKDEICQPIIKEAPIFVDSLCHTCRKHLRAALEYMEELALPYVLNHHLVRGFDYYNRTVFEIFAEGYEGALAAGGRYDYLVEMLGGRATSAVGGAIGIERAIEVMKIQNVNLSSRTRPKVFFVHIGDLAKKQGLTIMEQLIAGGIDVVESLGKESLKSQLKVADKHSSPLSLIFGQQEAFEGSIIIRDMKTGAQETVPLKKMIEAIKRKLR